MTALRVPVEAPRLSRRLTLHGATPRSCDHERCPRVCPASGPRLEGLALEFLVSQDEEYVRLYVIRGRYAFDLGTRNRNYLLLTLARRRLAESAQGLAKTARGWIDVEELARDPSMAPPRLNLDVFRLRRQFRPLAEDGDEIIERRASTRQIRLGTDRVTIRRV